MTELEFIDALRRLPLHAGARGLADDAAVIEIGGEALVLTQDTLVEGVHVPSDWEDAADTAWKLVAANLSDLAAKGAEPVGIMLSHALGMDDDRFLAGLREILERYDVPLIGGDTVAVECPRSWTVTAIGRATHRPVPARSGARFGDAVYLCGTIGNAMRGYDLLTQGERHAVFTPAYLRPEPKLSEGRVLAPIVTAMMDVSDGLLIDADRIAKASGVSIDIASDAVPFSAEFKVDGDIARCEAAMRWGDDYALLFTAPPEAELPISAARIGTATPSTKPQVLLDGHPPPPGEPLGYTHGG